MQRLQQKGWCQTLFTLFMWIFKTKCWAFYAVPFHSFIAFTFLQNSKLILQSGKQNQELLSREGKSVSTDSAFCSAPAGSSPASRLIPRPGLPSAAALFCLPAWPWFVEPAGGRSELSHRLESANNEPRCLWRMAYIPPHLSALYPAPPSPTSPSPNQLLNPKVCLTCTRCYLHRWGLCQEQRKAKGDQCCPKVVDRMRGTF